MAIIFSETDQVKNGIFEALEAVVEQTPGNKVVTFTSQPFLQLKKGQQYLVQALVRNVNWDDVKHDTRKSRPQKVSAITNNLKLKLLGTRENTMMHVAYTRRNSKGSRNATRQRQQKKARQRKKQLFQQQKQRQQK